MLMRKLIAVLCPLLLCLITCVLYHWLDGLMAAGFFLYLLKGLLLGVCIALLLPLGGISARNNGLARLLYIAAALLLAILVYQLLESSGVVHWDVLRALFVTSPQNVLVESAVMSFLAVTATLNVKRRA